MLGVGEGAVHEPLQVVHRELGVVDAEEQREVAPVAVLLDRAVARS